MAQEKRIAELRATLAAQDRELEAKDTELERLNKELASVRKVTDLIIGRDATEVLRSQTTELERLRSALKNLLGFMSSGDCETEFERAVKEAEDALNLQARSQE